ncbi:Copper/zinc superoxide dismutase (SODC) [Nesidiocoris tenuis]|uniref:Copper/zinc superoxide dismutase (SODC) n=1 Tax=Nesidiocoris tenuis TaxID=355587 RepID=A0ABN7B0K7_9HEMI|nr:Copper/zinc superoxide dismutase (SODC) [Nesidiocoris tenuis]
MFVILQCLAGTLVLSIISSSAAELTAHLSENGIHGFISFIEEDGQVYVAAKLTTESSWTWRVQSLPVDYTEIDDRCSDKKLGPMVLDLTGVLGEVSNSTSSLVSRSDLIPLTGTTGIWSRSLLLESNGKRACSTLMASGNSSVKVAEAHFPGDGGLRGRVLFQWFGSSSATDAVIHSDLHWANDRLRTSHNWRIYTTDVLESEVDKAKENCNSLQVILMDLGTRLDGIRVGDRQLYRDPNLPHMDTRNKKRQHFLVILDNDHPDTYLTCARIRFKPPTLVRALVSAHGVVGYLNLEQRSQLTPTKVRLNISRVAEPVLGGFRIHMLPALPPLDNSPHLDRCREIGAVYNPTSKGVAAEAPIPGELSQDNYALGDISGKLGYAAEREWDCFLPLMGKHSVVFRTLVIYRNGESGIEEPWICTTLTRYKWAEPEYKMPILSAEAVYRYPLVGRVIFYQPDPYGETTVLVEGLIHADGMSQNTTSNHRWSVTVNPPGKDFFNWTARCVSAGPVYNPFNVNPNKTTESVVGDLTARLGMLQISGGKKLLRESRVLFTDDNIPLAGHNSIYEKSLVIYDDNGPQARGDRLACSRITGIFRRKAVAKDWFGNGSPTTVSGKVEFFQRTEYSISDIEVNLEGLQNIDHFQIHRTPVLEILEFPCEETTLYEVYNPYGEHPPFHAGGTPDQLRAGDLSGKFGTLEGHSSFQQVGWNDTNLMLFGQTSIIGRSIVLHSKSPERRWACSTIERGYAPSEARELRAIASFHHPLGFAYGYIRMTQLIHSDGSSSDTIMEVNLRHPGKHDRNVTFNHNWAIFVNFIGVDATVQVLNTRCTAAGYVWNPYYTQLADPLNEELYRRECGPDLPLRCYVGDLSARLGPISLGAGRKVFTDANVPLEGKVSAMGRSIVIFNKDRGSERFACANIEPDYDTVKYVNIRRPPKFVVSQFLDDVRNIMGVPDWFLTVDSRKTNLLYNGACIQLLIHFKGPQANKLEQDFSRLLTTGKLPQQSLYNPGYTPPAKRVTTSSYQLCPSRDSTEMKKKRFSFSLSSSSAQLKPLVATIVAVLLPILLS